MSKKIMLFMLTICILGLVACGKENKVNDNIEVKESNNKAITEVVEISLGESHIKLDFSENKKTHEPSMLTTEKELDIVIGNYENWIVQFQGIELKPNSTIKYQIENLSKDDFLVISYENVVTGETGEQYIATLPYAVRDFYVISNVDDGVYYYAHEGYAFKMNSEGNIIFYYRDDTTNYRYINEFKKVDCNGKTFYLITAQENSHEWPSLGDGAGPNAKVIILDENYEVYDVISELGTTNRTSSGIPLDQHDFIMLDEGHYILMGYLPVLATNIPANVPHDETGSRVVAAVIQEIINKEVIFEWYSTDYEELYELLLDEGGDYFNKKTAWYDYMHINSFDIDEADNNFICSFRTPDTMMKIDRNTGDIIWKLSGSGDEFGLSEEQKTQKQHDFRKVGENTYSAYDNGFAIGQTRVVEYTLDEVNKKLIDFKEYFIEGMYSPYQGNAQKIENGERYLVGGGMWQSHSQAFFYDVDFETKQILFEVVPQKGTNAYDMVYRAYRFDK